MGTARCRAASRSWSRSTGAARVAAATTAQAVRRSGKRSRASALAEAGAGSPSRPPLTRSPGPQAHPSGSPRNRTVGEQTATRRASASSGRHHGR